MKKYTINDFIEKDIAVIFSNKEEVSIFLDECKKYKTLYHEVKTYEDSYINWMGSSRYKFCLRFGYEKGITGAKNILTVGSVPSGWEVAKFKDFVFDNNHNQEIHITVKDSETHAILKENGKVVKHEVAKCHPDDEFDFNIGSKLAFKRLFNEEDIVESNDEGVKEDELLNCSFEVLCNNSKFLKQGQVYEVKNGRFDYQGTLYPIFIDPFKSFSELKFFLDECNKHNGYCFEEATIKIKEINKVKRLAKPGEYIMITDNNNRRVFNDSFKIGDVLKVQSSSVLTGICSTLVDDKYVFLSKDRYVVLEDYESIKKTKKVLAFECFDLYIYPQLNILGTKINKKDIKGDDLHIGDVVRIYDKNNNFIKYLTIVKRKITNTTRLPDRLENSTNGMNDDGRWFVLEKGFDLFKPGVYNWDFGTTITVKEIWIEDND